MSGQGISSLGPAGEKTAQITSSKGQMKREVFGSDGVGNVKNPIPACGRWFRLEVPGTVTASHFWEQPMSWLSNVPCRVIFR